jgi:hypothetical protein
LEVPDLHSLLACMRASADDRCHAIGSTEAVGRCQFVSATTRATNKPFQVSASSPHSQIHNHFPLRRHHLSANQHRAALNAAFREWRDVAGVAPAM